MKTILKEEKKIELKELLLQVQKPGQYLGNEWNHLVNEKKWSNAKAKAAIIYPDLYELGMSNFGIKILYKIINEEEDFLCD